ncbi:MAG: glycosyltransferase family 2 protein [Desulfobacterota bacterium]|nr:glycosyltransferase family 2 protein [Thermodesulfobacteriota bacterium]
MNTMPCIYAVVVTWNAAPWIRAALISLRASTLPVHVIVVDNASTDMTCSIVKDQFPEASLLPLPRNLGFGVANNYGIHYALRHGAQYVLLLNQDATVFPDTIQHLVTVLEAYPDIGIVSPLHKAGSTSHLEPLFFDFIRGRADLISDALHGTLRDAYDIDFVNAAIWLVRRSVFEQVGGFDPIFFMYGEDNDYCARTLFHGFRICIVPTAWACHSGGSIPGVNEPFIRSVRRATSRTIAYLKRPAHRFYRSCLSYLVVWAKHGIILLINGSLRMLIAESIGLCRAYLRLWTIRKHYLQCRRPGKLWLGDSPS